MSQGSEISLVHTCFLSPAAPQAMEKCAGWLGGLTTLPSMLQTWCHWSLPLSRTADNTWFVYTIPFWRALSAVPWECGRCGVLPVTSCPRWISGILSCWFGFRALGRPRQSSCFPLQALLCSPERWHQGVNEPGGLQNALKSLSNWVETSWGEGWVN